MHSSILENPVGLTHYLGISRPQVGRFGAV